MTEEYFISMEEEGDAFGPFDEKTLERWKRMAAREGMTPRFGKRIYVSSPIIPEDGRPKPFRECAFTRTADPEPRIKAKVHLRRVLLVLLALAGLAAVVVGVLGFVLRAV